MYEWLQQNLPEWLLQLLPWLGGFSLVCFVLTPVLVWLLIVRMPADYFCREDDAAARRHPVIRALLQVLRNLLGAVLVLAGVAMLVLPGQGILTILIGLVAMDFPGKKGLERRLVQRPLVRKAIDAIRRRAKVEPLVLDAPPPDPDGV